LPVTYAYNIQSVPFLLQSLIYILFRGKGGREDYNKPSDVLERANQGTQLLHPAGRFRYSLFSETGQCFR